MIYYDEKLCQPIVFIYHYSDYFVIIFTITVATHTITYHIKFQNAFSEGSCDSEAWSNHGICSVVACMCI